MLAEELRPLDTPYESWHAADVQQRINAPTAEVTSVSLSYQEDSEGCEIDSSLLKTKARQHSSAVPRKTVSARQISYFFTEAIAFKSTFGCQETGNGAMVSSRDPLM